MKRVAQIAFVAALLFVVLAVAEERETFAKNWFRAEEKFVASPADERAAADAVHSFRTLAAHWYATGGDARFAERLPASPPLVDELRADIAYVARNGRSEVPRLMRMEVLASRLSSESDAEVRTREFWVTEFRWGDGRASDETRSDVLHARYRLQRDGARWIVSAWDPVDPPEAAR